MEGRIVNERKTHNFLLHSSGATESEILRVRVGCQIHSALKVTLLNLGCTSIVRSLNYFVPTSMYFHTKSDYFFMSLLRKALQNSCIRIIRKCLFGLFALFGSTSVRKITLELSSFSLLSH